MDNSNPVYNRAYGDINAPDYRGQIVTINGYTRSTGAGCSPAAPYGYPYPGMPPARPSYGYPYYPYGYPPYGAYPPPPPGYYYPRPPYPPYPYPYPYIPIGHRPGCPAAQKDAFLDQPSEGESEAAEVLEEAAPVYYEEPAKKRKSGGVFAAIFEALFVVIVFGGVSSLLYFMDAIWYGYAIVAGAAILIFISYSDRSKFFRFLSWLIALALCFAALYIARPDLNVPVLDSIIASLNEILSVLGLDFVIQI
ncbi:MAG: hypothetical protein LBP62_02605 [Clostridiales bacterium]|jgi:hypothetical protein|nr:hypothetical protein [Clostridiales bacterium]